MGEEEIQTLVEEISINYFGKPFKHRAFFNSRLRTTGGRYMLQSHNIELNRKYYDHYGMDELIGIIKHELCHYHLHLEKKGYKHGDYDFKQLMKKVGAPRFCTPIPMEGNKKKATYVYVCVNCGLQYQRKRNIDVRKYRCGRCKSKIKKV